MQIIYTPEVEDYLDSLIFTLYEKDYFSYLESAKEYVSKIVSEIEFNIAIKRKHTSSDKMKRYGMYFITISINKGTTWYVFFNVKDSRYIVRYITNNHKDGHNIYGFKK